MEDRLREYETTFIVQPEISDEGIAQLHGRIDGLLERNEATRLLYDDMGRRKLAYEIRKFQKGHYWTVFYLDDGSAVPELERMLRLEDSVLRYLTIMAIEEVQDIEGRMSEAAEQEKIRVQKAAERKAREAEEAAAAAAAEAEVAESSDESDESDSEDSDESSDDDDSEGED